MITIAKKLGANFKGYGYPFNGTERLQIASTQPERQPFILSFTLAQLTTQLQCVAAHVRNVGGWVDGWFIYITTTGEIHIQCYAVYLNQTVAYNTGFFVVPGEHCEIGMYCYIVAGSTNTFYDVYINGQLKATIRGNAWGWNEVGGVYIGANHSNQYPFYGTIWQMTVLPYFENNRNNTPSTANNNPNKPFYAKIIGKHYNSGRSVLPEYAYPLQYIEGAIDFNSHLKRRFKTNKRYIVSGGYYHSSRAYSYYWFNNFEKLAPFRIGAGVRAGVVGQVESALLKDYIYGDNQVNFSGLQKTGAWGRVDSLSTDIPATWAGKSIELNSNKWGGTTASEITDSVITNLNCLNFYGHTQTSLGFDRTNIEIAANIGMLHIYSARKKRITITSKNNVVRTIDQLYIYANNLEQTYDSICNPDIVQWKYLAAANNGNLLTGTITKISPIATGIDLQNCAGMNGALPPIPDTCVTVALSGSNVTALNGYDFKNNTLLYWHSAQVAGILKFRSCWDIRATWTNANPITLDFSGLTAGRHLGLFEGGGTKITQILLPTTVGAKLVHFNFQNHTLAPLNFNNRTDVMFDKGNGWSTTQVSIFSFKGIHDYVFPFGSVIISNQIALYNIGISTANTNASIDNYLNGKANFEPTNYKCLYMFGDNHGLLTNEGRATRIEELIALTYSHNLITRIKHSQYKFESYIKIVAIAKGPVPTDIILTTHVALNIWDFSLGTQFFELLLSPNSSLNGAWTYVSRGNDAGATNNNAGQYLKFRRTDFDNSTLTTTTAVLHTRNSNLNPV